MYHKMQWKLYQKKNAHKLISKLRDYYYKQIYLQGNMPINMCKFFILLYKFDKNELNV